MKKTLSAVFVFGLLFCFTACSGGSNAADDSVTQALTALQEQVAQLEKRITTLESAPAAAVSQTAEETPAQSASGGSLFDVSVLQGIWTYDIPRTNQFIELRFSGNQEIQMTEAVYDGGAANTFVGRYSAFGSTLTLDGNHVNIQYEGPPLNAVIEVILEGEKLNFTFVSGDSLVVGLEKPGDVASFVSI